MHPTPSEYAEYRRTLAHDAAVTRRVNRILTAVVATVMLTAALMSAAAGAWLTAATLLVLPTLVLLAGRWIGRHRITLDAYGQPVTAEDADRLDRLRAHKLRLAHAAQNAHRRFHGHHPERDPA